MSASRPFRSTTTPPSTAPTCCENRKPANRAEEDHPKTQSQITEPTNEAGRRLYRCSRGGDLGTCLRRKPDCARRVLAGADDDAALCHRRCPLPVRAQARCVLAAAACDQLLAVP